MLNLTLRRKINNDKITDKLIQKLKNEGGKEMLAIFDTIDEENRRILNQGRKEGNQEGRKDVAQRLKKEGISIEIIIKCTGLSSEQIRRL